MPRQEFGIACLLVVHSCLLCPFSNAQTEAESTREKTNSVWTWKDDSDRTRTREDLRAILAQHKLWLESRGKSGARATLQGADLTLGTLEHAIQLGPELRGADLRRADLSSINLSFADLSGADLDGANLAQAKLAAAQLVDADLSHADLTGSMLLLANLTAARMVGTELRDADFYGADLKLAVFEPKSLPNVRGIGAALNLDSTSYLFFPNALATLRKEFEDTGLREQERRITYALRRSETEHVLTRKWPLVFVVAGVPKKEGEKQIPRKENTLLLKRCLESPSDCAEYAFRRLLFDITCRYGMEPLRPLRLLFALWLLCSLAYSYFMESTGHLGLYKVKREHWGGRELAREIRIRPRPMPVSHGSKRMRLLFVRQWQVFRVAMLFSAMSAFNIGFRDFNFGRWVRALTHEEFDIRAKGWSRTLAGFQSLISTYLLALTVLTYFGRPFA